MIEAPRKGYFSSQNQEWWKLDILKDFFIFNVIWENRNLNRLQKFHPKEQQKTGDNILSWTVRCLSARRQTECLRTSGFFSSHFPESGTKCSICLSEQRFCLHCGSLIPWQDCFQIAIAIWCHWCYRTVPASPWAAGLTLVELNCSAGK